MKKALWFSRHEVTEDQKKDAQRLGYGLITDDQLTEAASRELLTDADVQDVLDLIDAKINEHQAFAIFGVFPTPVLAERLLDIEHWIVSKTQCPAIPGFAAWNGGRDSGFKHLRFQIVTFFTWPHIT